jgi:hypothetical protein
MGNSTTRHGESGVALLTAIMVLMLMSALLLGFVAVVNTDQTSNGIGRDQTQAYAGAHAGLEKLTADLGKLFTTNYAPTGAAVNGLEAAPPAIPGITFVKPNGAVGYDITYIDLNGDGIPDVEKPAGSDITSGPYAGLKGIITPYTADVTARTIGGAEVRMRRTMQSVGVPVFQFGIFSESDQSFHAGDDFYFAGRVHTNGNLFLASAAGKTLTLGDRVTAVGQIVRREFVNGASSTGYTGAVNMAFGSGCTDAVTTNCRNLQQTEGSVTTGLSPLSLNSNWTTISVTTYQQWIRNGLSGAKRLDLPLVSDGAEAIDLIRRGTAADTTQVAAQRFYNMASLRILIADTAAELTALPGAVGTPVSLEALGLPAGAGSHRLAGASGTGNYRSLNNTPVLGGYILINKQDNVTPTSARTDVTNAVLAQGITGNKLTTPCVTATHWHPNAIIRLQHVSDSATCAVLDSSTPFTNLWPNALYDPREGVRREEDQSGFTDPFFGGVMYYVELDVANLKRWFEGSLPALAPNGAGSQNTTGYVVYFSDRRGNNNGTASTGEYGWEDVVNTGDAGTPNNSLDPGEDFNGNGSLEIYGRTPRLATFNPTTTPSPSPYVSGSTPATQVTAAVAKVNRAIFFRRALKLVNGALGQLPFNGPQGLTVASENPVYIQGHYNACNVTSTAASCINSDGFVDGASPSVHKSAAVVADSVTLLSRTWNDNNSFVNPHSIASRVAGDRTFYRLGIISGKGRPFPKTGSGTFANFGSDGGAHNFLRFMEDWDGKDVFYKGSMISLYFSRQGTGVWKYGESMVYFAPTRNMLFDTEFLTPSLLPPRTPMFRDINTLTFRQILRPTQQ